jgi:hypothetical protein
MAAMNTSARSIANSKNCSHSSTFVSPTVVPIQLTAARIDDASRPAGASRNHDTRRLHAIAPGLVGQTIERAGGYK